MGKRFWTLFHVIILLMPAISHAQSYGGWQQIDSMKEARYNHSAIQLFDGSVLVVGGVGLDDPKSCEIYDINSSRWILTAKTNYARWRHRLIMLDSKCILAVGSSVTKSCEIYDPNLNVWTLTDSLSVGRVLAQHQVVKLSNGKILVIGGSTNDFPITENRTLKQCEIYDEANGKWSIADSLNERRNSHTATLLNDGRVLVTGGTSSVDPLAGCEIYDPVQNRWSVVASMNIARKYHSAVLLPNGKVLVISGYIKDNMFPTNKCEVYDPILDKWELVGNVQEEGSSKVSFIIDERNIILVGSSNQILIWEIYDYNEFRSKSVGYVKIGSFSNTTIQLGDGRVLLTGGVTTPDNFMYLPVKKCWMFDKNLTHIAEIDNQQERVLIFQTYPNPFNSSTKMKFFVERSSNVQITIYNTLGEKIEDLINERKERGFHEALFSNKNLPSGIYFYNLTTSTGSITKKMMLIK